MESDKVLPLERSFYIGNMFSAIMYGLQIYMTIHSVYLLRAPSHDSGVQRQKLFYASYSILLLLCMSFAFIANALMGQMMWIEHRDFDGGPVAWWLSNGTVWFNVVGSAFDMFGNFLGDALLIYRCAIIWGKRWYVIFLPVLMFLASTALAILSVVESALPGSSFFQTHVINFAVPWISLTCTLNAIVTVLIAGRILYARKQIREVMPEIDADVYTGIVAILIESALPFTLVGIVFAIVLSKEQPVQLFFADLWGSYVGLAPQLIILRVAMGRAWSKNTLTQVSTRIDFIHNKTGTTTVDSTQIGTVRYTESHPSVLKSISESSSHAQKLEQSGAEV
ncbi:hypothetical protein K435DRAFT_781429 [Dendrothele bispora CBS 962.96]|uniref:Uncharacterized protein n=1 Tax=Dendrothele bispora (strain CBS 962.96) TaxID=1314807 RepID=A0A4S8LMI5_DENBC|nr:hypothetical protein K435DRAFT_781429 [Dendrothele bispora CBS 962.96]